MTKGTEPPILPGCSVLPPMEPAGAGGMTTGEDNGKPVAGAGDKAKGMPKTRKAAERFATMNAFVDVTMRNLHRTQALLWFCLWRDTKPNGTARTSQADLARRVGVSDRSIRRAIAALRGRGLLEVTYRGGLGRGPSAYVVRAVPPDR